MSPRVHSIIVVTKKIFFNHNKLLNSHYSRCYKQTEKRRKKNLTLPGVGRWGRQWSELVSHRWCFNYKVMKSNEFSNYIKAGRHILICSNKLRKGIEIWENMVLSGNTIYLGYQGNEDGKVNMSPFWKELHKDQLNSLKFSV